jgi:hypothetical protein
MDPKQVEKTNPILWQGKSDKAKGKRNYDFLCSYAPVPFLQNKPNFMERQK